MDSHVLTCDGFSIQGWVASGYFTSGRVRSGLDKVRSGYE